MRMLVSRNAMTVVTVVMIALLTAFALLCSGEENFAEGRHSHAAKASAVHLCDNDGAMGPCGCPLAAVAYVTGHFNKDGRKFGNGAKYIAVTTIGSLVDANDRPDVHVKWHVKGATICAAYDEYQVKSNLSFRQIPLKTGPHSGKAVIKRAGVHLSFWLRQK